MTIAALLAPQSVAVIGASRKRGTIGGELFHNLLACGFNGPVYPVHPTVKVVQSVRAYPDVRDVPDRVDLAVLAVPAEAAADTLTACGEKGVKAAVIISAGFKEVGGKGLERELVLRNIGRHYGMRLVGPNCLGVLNTDPAVSLNATFARQFPTPGPVSFISQSGALGAVVLELAMRRNIGFSSFVSVGNKCDVSGNDLLEYWETDERTRVILMYLESFGNPRRFTQIARRVGQLKPIIAVKSGRTPSGLAAAASHTGALGGADNAVDALFRQAGVIRVDTTEELFDTAMLLASQPTPRGRRVGIITNAGGPGIITSDACESLGLQIPPVGADTTAILRAFLPQGASLRNPVDMIASATAEHYGRAVSALLRDPAIDSVIVIFVPPLMVATEDVARAIAKVAADATKPIISCYMGAYGFPEGLLGEGNHPTKIPSYRFPESAVKALARSIDHGEWLGVANSPVPEIRYDAEVASSTVEACRDVLENENEAVWLDASDVPRLLEAYGIRVPKSALAASAMQAVAHAKQFGFPVALKIVSDQIVHKADVGGVIVDRRDPEEVEAAFHTIMNNARRAGLESSIQGILVQQFIGSGIEAVVGMVQDPIFGPLIMFGYGGAYVELVRDVVFRLHPLTDHDIDFMIRSLKTSKLLNGYRGAPPGDIPALRDLLARVSQLVGDVPELLEMDLNPVKILPPGQGCIAVDARVRLGTTNSPRLTMEPPRSSMPPC